MENDDLSTYLNALQREDCYRVDRVLKESAYETTQQVSFVGANGATRGPYVRKLIARGAGMGGAYERLYAAQQSGRRFKYLPEILECYANNEHLVVVMEFARGETLQDVVERLGGSVAFARSVFPMLCDAVSELHEDFHPPIIHRDLKPSNVMLAEGGLTIIDFGIARDFKDGAEADTTHFGTRPFAPPEQFGFGQTTERSDVYALGKVLSYCVTGETPASDSPVQAGMAGVPPMVRAIIERATSFAPEMRYASARDLKEAFERAVSSAQEPRQPQSSQSLSGEAQRPKPGRSLPGEIWNAFVGIVAGAGIIMSFGKISNPDPSVAGRPLYYLFILYAIVMPFTLLCLGYLLLDKRRLRVRFPVLAKVKWWYIVAAWCVLFMAAVFAVVVIMRLSG